MIADSINSPGGREAVSIRLAEAYIREFGNLAQKTNTMIVPSNVADVSGLPVYERNSNRSYRYVVLLGTGMIAQGLSIFDMVRKSTSGMGAISKEHALQAALQDAKISTFGRTDDHGTK